MSNAVGNMGSCLFHEALHRAVSSTSQPPKSVLSSSILVVAPAQSSNLPPKSDYRVLFIKRAAKSSFMPGAHVFPGGGICGPLRSASLSNVQEYLMNRIDFQRGHGTAHLQTPLPLR